MENTHFHSHLTRFTAVPNIPTDWAQELRMTSAPSTFVFPTLFSVCTWFGNSWRITLGPIGGQRYSRDHCRGDMTRMSINRIWTNWPEGGLRCHGKHRRWRLLRSKWVLKLPTLSPFLLKMTACSFLSMVGLAAWVEAADQAVVVSFKLIYHKMRWYATVEWRRRRLCANRHHLFCRCLTTEKSINFGTVLIDRVEHVCRSRRSDLVNESHSLCVFPLHIWAMKNKRSSEHTWLNSFHRWSSVGSRLRSAWCWWKHLFWGIDLRSRNVCLKHKCLFPGVSIVTTTFWHQQPKKMQRALLTHRNFKHGQTT